MAHPAPQRERCVQCSKIVYPQERLSIDSQVYHKMCLRCKTCATTLAIHNYVNVKGSIFCKRHVPLEGSGPKINVHAELQLSPRPTATADGQQAAPPPQPRASPRQNALVPPLSPRSQAISTNYVNPRLSPRLPPTAHPANFGAPAVHAAPKLPPTAHPAPAVFVHTSSNHKVAVPEAFTHSTPPATSNMSHSASSEEEDATTPPPPAPAAEGTTANGAVPRTESKERDRSRSDRTRKGSGKESSKERHGSGKERGRSERSDGKSNNTLGVSATSRTKKDKSTRLSGDRHDATRLSGDKHDAAPEPSHPEKPSVGSAPPAPTPAPGPAPAQATAAAEAHHPPALAPLNIAAAVAQPVHTPAPPIAPSPRAVQPSPRGGHPVIPMAPHEAPHPHPPHLTSSYHPHTATATAPAVHVAPPAGHNAHPSAPTHSATTPSLASTQTGSGKKKHDVAPVISGPLTPEELLRMREGKERLPVPAAAAPHGNTSPRLHEELHPKVGAEKAALLAFAKQPENQRCADCGTSPAEWASANLGIFVCIACSGSHRALGTHISKVKSVMLDEWTQAEIDHMLANGNSKAAAVQHPVQLPPDVAMDKDTPQAQRNAVVRARYTNTAYVVPQDGDHKSQRKDTTKMVMAAGVLKINVIEGRNLPSKDLNGYSDPYVVIMQQGQRAGKTNKIKKTLNPKWNETVMVNLPSLAEKLTVQVWDWDRIGSHNFMGEAPLNLMMYNITPNSSVKFWLPVYAKEKQQGEVSLELTYFPIG